MADSADSKPEETPQEEPKVEEPAKEEPKAEEPPKEEAPKEEPKAEAKEEEPKAEAKEEEPKAEVKEEPKAEAKEEEPKAETKEEEPKTEAKEEPKKKRESKRKSRKEPKPQPDRHVVHAGFVHKAGQFFKSFKREFLSLEEDGKVLRVFKNENRQGAPSFQLFMKACVRVSARTEEHAATNWPAGIEVERCFLVQSPNRVVYMHDEDADKAKEWVEKLEEARSKFSQETEIVMEKLFTGAGVKSALNRLMGSAEADAQKLKKDVDKEGEKASKEEKKEDDQPPPAEEGAAAAAAAEPVTTEAEVTPEQPKTEETPKEEPKAEEPPAEEPKTEETPAEEPKAEEPPPEEPKADETPKEDEQQKEEGGTPE